MNIHKRNPSNGHGALPAVQITVTVSPTSVNGNDVECDITGTGVTDNSIFLSGSAGGEITFNLVAGPAGTFAFDTGNPFGNQMGRCPRNAAKPRSPCSLASSPAPTASSFTMNVAPITGKAVSFYRLNFTQGKSCDPIIIHE
jgi:hypothetical protein